MGESTNGGWSKDAFYETALKDGEFGADDKRAKKASIYQEKDKRTVPNKRGYGDPNVFTENDIQMMAAEYM